METYSVGAQNINEISDWKILLRSYFINLIVYSVIIITIIILITKYVAPLFINNGWNQIFIAVFAFIVLSPFLWALAFRRIHGQAYANVWLKTSQRGPLIILQLSRIALAVFYMGFLFDRLFSPWTAFRAAIVSCIILVIFSKKIKTFYGKIETSFFNNFNGRETKTADKNEALTPWDTHITVFELNAQSPYVGKTLSEIQVREVFGVNIAMIERGDIVINVPTRQQRLYPHDKISVIGTDEQLQKFKIYLESSVRESLIENTKQKVSLHHFTVGEKSKLINKNIRESKIRERSNSLVVGIERNGSRILNPESDLVFEINDKVWIVGNEKRIKILMKEFTG